ncbi:probable secretion ATPase protein,similar to bacterial type II secretion system protein E [Aromatoleum aromaticum EbN1]|uniref:Probable secretion ATPase protein,similar to bacterial type II secretion system protein E n=1 Tax=Aromatoleum aromaticum (strain DSM 19018 / LMG 30748 / EbN1) TaxID=76114 RepID=Q5P3A4_AROAE|nr:CpaF family protein [Aromatoleum aromaticum]CAI08210.1 probable secretion ATPase protein,similar to bacterial type II secretion system protein E [Aromatoleum aromaticum EbN1]
MSLRQRLESVSTDTVMRPAAAPDPRANKAYQTLKMRIHQLLLSRIDLEAMESLGPDQLRDELRLMVERLLAEENVVINTNERRDLVRDIQYEMLGLGPIEPLLADPTVSDILINGSQQIYVERHGKIELTPVTFSDDAHLMKIIDKIVSRVGRRVDESSPMVDARLPDGSRVNAIIPPLALDGPVVSIRRFAAVPLTMEKLIGFKALTPEMGELLAGLARAKVNILISGGTGSGKTTLLNILTANIPADERIVTIEDAAELQLQQPHVVRLETRPPNIEGKGEVSQRALVRNALRMRPDRIILGETRGAEAFDVLQAMNTGHEGSMTTVHANTPRDALGRMENMIGMSDANLPPKVARSQIASAIGLIVQASRLTDGKRKIISIQEITGMEGEMITMQEIFAFRQTGISETGEVQGYFTATGVRPHFAERLRSFGIRLPEDMFNPGRRFE